MLRAGTFIFFLAIMLAPFSGSSQNFIGKTYKEVKKKLKRYQKSTDSFLVKITDSAEYIKMSVLGRDNNTADFVYGFDDKGKCKSEKVIAYCDSCYKKYLDAVLAEKKYGWKKINMNQYISSFEHHLMIELPVIEDKSLFYIILRTNWIKETYEIMNPKK